MGSYGFPVAGRDKSPENAISYWKPVNSEEQPVLLNIMQVLASGWFGSIDAGR